MDRKLLKRDLSGQGLSLGLPALRPEHIFRRNPISIIFVKIQNSSENMLLISPNPAYEFRSTRQTFILVCSRWSCWLFSVSVYPPPPLRRPYQSLLWTTDTEEYFRNRLPNFSTKHRAYVSNTMVFDFFYIWFSDRISGFPTGYLFFWRDIWFNIKHWRNFELSE